MPLIQVIIVIAIVGFIVWLITSLVPMPPQFKTAIVAVACVIILLWLLSLFMPLGTLRIGR